MKLKQLSLVLLIAVIFTACSENTNSDSTVGRLSIQLTDAPFPHDLVAEANVTVFKVEARYQGSAQNIDSTDATVEMHDGKPFVVLMENEIEVNLLDLTNGLTQSLADLDVPVGTYDLLRIYVKGTNVVMKNGDTYDLKVPSGSQSGIKVFMTPALEINGGLSSDLLLDFDVSKSFVAKGYNKKLGTLNGFNFKPVIKASNIATTGSLKGVITGIEENIAQGPIEGVQVGVFIADTLNTTSFTDADGAYMIMGLDAGTYTIEVDKDPYVVQTLDGVEITAGGTTVRDFEIVVED